MNEKIRSLIADVDDLIDGVKRMTKRTRRIREDIHDNPHLHLQPCSICKVTLTRFGTCAACDMKSNGHSKL